MKVGKNNFRPPPKVESSVVRIEPRVPPPAINFKEWDGLLRIVFSRKNKTLGGSFRTKSVLKMMEQNYKAVCAMADPPVELSPEFDMKELVVQILTEHHFIDRRAKTMDIDDFLRLLDCFNKSNIHFQ
eukprot:m.138453 g.138453  ORF g.138453 m.138453 type:complete len:128 (+) comp20267_c0_seq4:1050-1433(+)